MGSDNKINKSCQLKTISPLLNLYFNDTTESKLKSFPRFVQLQWRIQKNRVVTNSNLEVNAISVKKNVMLSMKNLFGEVGVSTNIDLLTYNKSNHRGIIRCPSDLYVKLRAALTLFVTEDQCTFKVINSSPLLISLVANSRTYIH